jgi:hypothetical protein
MMTGDPVPQHLKVSDRFPSTAKLPSTVGVVIGSTADEAPTEDGVDRSVGGRTVGSLTLPPAQPDRSRVSAVTSANTVRRTLGVGLWSAGVARSRLIVAILGSQTLQAPLDEKSIVSGQGASFA